MGATRGAYNKPIPKHWHGASKTRLYSIWTAMKRRCMNPNCADFQNYGGRGIGICNDWINSYEEFSDWAYKNGYSNALTIDRIDVNGNYEPMNCRWVSKPFQSNNRRSNKLLTYNGKTQNLKKWAEDTGISRNTISSRLNLYGWSVEKALTTSAFKGRNQYSED